MLILITKQEPRKLNKMTGVLPLCQMRVYKLKKLQPFLITYKGKTYRV